MNAVVDAIKDTRLAKIGNTRRQAEFNNEAATKLHADSRPVVNTGALVGTRITFVNRYFYPDISATSQMLFDLSRRLVKQGAIVNVLCSQQLYDDAQARLSEHEEVEGIHIHRVSTTRFGRNWLPGRVSDYATFYVSAFIKLMRLTQRDDVLVAKTDPPLISLAVGIVAKRRGAKLVNWLQDLFPEVASQLGARLPRWLDRYLETLRDRSLRMAAANVVIGSRMKNYLAQRHIDSSRLHVIQNWADGELVEPKPVCNSALSISLGLQDKFVVGYSGNLGRAHEFETILRAASALRLEKDVVFLMIGGGAKMQQLKKAVADETLDNFVFLNYQPRELLADSMAAADVHLISLLPNMEGLIVPSKFYGILAAGRPCIIVGDANGELANVVRLERCGDAVAVGDWEGLVSALWQLKLEPQYRQQLGARARSLFLERHTADGGAQQWSNLLVTLSQQFAEKVAQNTGQPT